MKNLAGDKEADLIIQEELLLAGLNPIHTTKSEAEVEASYIGRVGNWKLERAWSYWVARVENTDDGLTVEDASKLHEMKYPVNDSRLKLIGHAVRAEGDCTCPHPTKCGSLSKEVYENHEHLKWANRMELNKLCNNGTVPFQRYIECYHIDTTIGLKTFVDFVRSLAPTKNVQDTTFCPIILSTPDATRLWIDTKTDDLVVSMLPRKLDSVFATSNPIYLNYHMHILSTEPIDKCYVFDSKSKTIYFEENNIGVKEGVFKIKSSTDPALKVAEITYDFLINYVNTYNSNKNE